METVVSLVAPGAVIYYAMQQAPKGWLVCDGSEISIKEYPALYEAIGETYGEANDRGMFKLPDLRGEFIRGYDYGRGIDEKRMFGSYQKGSAAIVDPTVASGAIGGLFNAVDSSLSTALENAGMDSFEKGTYNGILAVVLDAPTKHPLEVAAGTVRPRNVALLACIKY